MSGPTTSDSYIPKPGELVRIVAVAARAFHARAFHPETHLRVTQLREWVDQVECVLAAFNLESLDELEEYLERLAAERKEAVVRAETAEAALIQAQAEYDEDSGAQWARADAAEAEAARQRTRAERAERERDEAHRRAIEADERLRELRYVLEAERAKVAELTVAVREVNKWFAEQAADGFDPGWERVLTALLVDHTRGDSDD